MRLNDIELTILVKGRPITEYPHNDQVFVEGRAGSEYEIEVRNHSYQRVEAVLSVDGLSVTDGKPAGTQSQGYLISSRGVVRIPGWTLTGATVAKFAFAGKQESYSAQTGQDTRNVGVIGAMVFREKLRPWVPPITISTPSYSPSFRGIAPTPFYGVATSSAGWSGSGTTMNSTVDAQSFNSAGSMQQQSLGTAFGDATTFATTTVAFERGDLLVTLLCHYDERRGLRARGVKIERRKPHPTPQAFPAMGCQPPPGWRG